MSFCITFSLSLFQTHLCGKAWQDIMMLQRPSLLAPEGVLAAMAPVPRAGPKLRTQAHLACFQDFPRHAKTWDHHPKGTAKKSKAPRSILEPNLTHQGVAFFSLSRGGSQAIMPWCRRWPWSGKKAWSGRRTVDIFILILDDQIRLNERIYHHWKTLCAVTFWKVSMH